MKRKICVTLLALSSGLMMVFAAAAVDKCTEKFDACKVTCDNLKAQLTARGSTPDTISMRHKQCLADCDKALKDCQAKSQPKK
jgi:hypothetical protein